MWEGNYKDGKIDGVWKDWDKQGNLIRETTYKDGKRTN
jgi:antitoxin component YwqK of YwqJK toxin-antitoxin module